MMHGTIHRLARYLVGLMSQLAACQIRRHGRCELYSCWIYRVGEDCNFYYYCIRIQWTSHISMWEMFRSMEWLIP